MRKKLLSLILSLCMILSVCSFHVSATTGKLSMDKTVFSLGEDIVFNYHDSASSKDFISIYYASNPGGTNSSNGELAWAYTVPASGTVTVDDFGNKDWATTPGSYLAKYWSADQYKVLLDSIYFTIIDPAEAEFTEYYVKKGGTGDGHSADSPMGTIVDIVKTINKGHITGDEVTVYVIDSGEASKTVIDSDCVIGYNNSALGQVPSHDATITYTSYAENVTSIIGHVNYQGAGSNAIHLLLAGPSRFENINILDMRNSNNGGTDIYLGNHSVSFNGVKFMDLKGANQGTMGEIFYPSSTHFSLGQTRGRKMVTGDAEVYLDNASLIGDYLSLTGYNDDTQTQGVDGDLTLRIGSGTLKNLYISSTRADEVVTGNASIVLGNGVKVSRLLAASNGKNLIVNGALQLVKNYGATVPADHAAAAHASTARDSFAPYYELTSMSDAITLDVTDTAGNFSVQTDGVAYAVSEDGLTVYYGTDTLTLPAGHFAVYSAENLEAVKNEAPKPSSDEVGIIFKGWNDDGQKLTAIFGMRDPVLKDYYVKPGGTGDGRTESAPAGTIGAVIDSINADGLEAIDTATVHIIRTEEDSKTSWQKIVTKTDDTETVVKDEVSAINFVGYETAKAHNAKIIYEGESAENLSTIVFAKNWGVTGNPGTHVHLKGPSEFKNIRLIDPRFSHYWVVYSRNFDLSFTGNSTIRKASLKTASATNDDGSTTTTYTISLGSWSGVLYSAYHYSENSKPIGGATFKINPSLINNKINLTSDVSSASTPTITVAEDTTLVLYGSGTQNDVELAGVTAATYTYDKNVNIMLDGASLKNLLNKASATIGGALQIITMGGAKLTNDASGVENKYTINAADGVAADFTETAGTFEVSGGNVIYTVSEDSMTIRYTSNGKFVAPAYGTYKLFAANSLDEIKAAVKAPAPQEGMEFAGWVEETAGVLSAKYQPRTPKNKSYYIKWGGTGDGLTKENPMGSVKQAVLAANATGELIKGDTITVYVMNDDTHTTLDSYNASHPEFWKYSADGRFIFNNGNLKNVEGRFTTWGLGISEENPVHEATLIVTSLDPQNPAYIAQHGYIGQNTTLFLSGPTVLRDINYVTTRKHDRELSTNGYDCTLENVKFYYQNSDNSQDAGTYLTGLPEGHFRVLLNHYTQNITDGPGGTLILKSPINATGGTYGLEIVGARGAYFTKPVSLYFDHSDMNLNLYWGKGANSVATFEKGLYLVVNNGKVSTHDAYTGKVNITGGLTIIANNGCALPVIPANVTADKKWILSVAEGGTADITETAGTFKLATEKQYWFAMNDDFTFICGKVSDGDMKLPEGSYNVYFTDSDPAANDCEAVRAVLLDYYASRIVFTKVSDGVYSGELPKVKQVMKMTDTATSNGHFEEGNAAATAAYPYIGENTTHHGFVVKKVTRNTANATGNASPMLYKYSPILDETGKQISVADARYISFRYYYAPGEGSDAPLVGKTAKWTQGKLYPGSWVSGIYGVSRDTYVANSWATITIDMWQNTKYKNNALSSAGTLSQYKFEFLNGTHLHDTDTLYISDVIFTNYDPAEDLAVPVMLHISENGNDENDGLSANTAVKTFARALELAKNTKSMLFSVRGNVAEGTYAGTYPELSALLIKGNSSANIENLTTACNITFDSDIAKNVNVANGMTATFEGGFDGDVTVTNGVAIADTEINVTVSDGAKAFVDIAGGSISQLNISGNVQELAVDVPSASAIRTVNVSDGATVKDIMTVTGYGVDVPAEIANIAVTGRSISVKTPIMKASTGEAFDITPIGFGKVKTYSGTEYNFGAGYVTYTAYAVSPDGYTAYYSNAKTGYVMTLGQSGTYQLDIACETGYNYSGNASKPVAGFAPETHLTLPDGATGWLDDGCGTITARTSGDSGSTYKTVYVSNRKGSDKNDGLTANTAFKTIKAAVNAIGLSNDGTVIVLDGKDANGNAEYTVYTRFKDSVNGAYVYTPEKLPIGSITQDVLFYDAPVHTGTITYEGDAPDSVIMSGANHLELAGPTIFKNISYIEGYNTGKNLVTCGRSFEIAGTVYKIPAGVADYSNGVANGGLGTPTAEFPIDTVGRSNSNTVGRLVLPEGYKGAVSFCAWDGSYTHSGAQTLVVNGANVTSVNIGNKAGTSHNILSVVYNAGTIGKIYNSATPIATTAKAVQIICNNGLTAPANTSTLAGTLGNWYVNSASEEGCALDVTGTAGTFTVLGDKYAKAQNADGAVIYSEQGTLTLPAGTWNVTYTDVLPYEICDGVVTANENVEIALSELDGAITASNGAFMGWAYDAEGAEFVSGDSVTIDAGEKLYGIYRAVDRTVGGDISVLGAQIRLASGETKQGLRFVSKVNKNLLNALGITDIGGENVKYGSVLIPENLMGEGELILGYTNGNYAAADVKAVNTYKTDASSVTYTAVLTGISDKNLTRLYKVRPYISYTDNNGAARIVYGECYSTGIYAVAAYALENDNTLDDEAKEILSGIKATAVDTLDAPVSIIAYKNAPASYEEATEEQFAKGEVFYKNADGMTIREVHIPGAKKETTAGVLTDLHINLLNEKDRYDPEIQLTYFTRTWLRNGATIKAINKSTAIASMYDQMIFTGDIIDYLSYGALDALKENVFDKYKDGLYALGGHDVTRNMETGNRDMTPLAERQALLREYWPHDIFYASRVVNDSVMFIQLDNGCSKYWASQVDKLAADIAKARENGYVVLIFQHEPISAGDTTATEVISYDSNDTNNFWYGENRVHYGYNADEATNAVYELITKNADVVRGVFAGHTHLSAYVEIKGSYVDENGNTVEATIPQYVTRPVAYETNNGSITKIVVTAE